MIGNSSLNLVRGVIQLKGFHKDLSLAMYFLTYFLNDLFYLIKNARYIIMLMVIPCQMHLLKLKS